jgi:SusD family.
MKRYSTIALAAALAVAAGCKDNPVANPIDAPTVDALAGGLTPTSLLQLVTGALAQDRTTFNDVPGIIEPGIFARDAYRLDQSEQRYVTETLGGNPDPGSFAGGRAFAGYYTALRAENNLILALNTSTGQFTAAELSATKGFMRTMKALEYYRLIELRDTVGVPIQTDDGTAVNPIRCREAVQSYIAALLDSANADFTAAGGTTVLPVKLPLGFSQYGRDYNVVSNLVKFNRGLKGKLDFYRGLDRKAPTSALFAPAIAELTAALGAGPGAVPASQFGTGAYYNFVAGGTENTPNTIADDKIAINPLLKDSVQAGDTRGAKIVARASTLTVTQGGATLSSAFTFANAVPTAANQIKPVAILRDEELVLLRAQAYIENGDLPNALLDLNSVRTSYGLAPTVFTSKTDAINKVLYEKRYSLLFEGAQRWADLRDYGRLNATYLRKELPADPFNAALPLPRAELDARNVATNPACTA